MRANCNAARALCALTVVVGIQAVFTNPTAADEPSQATSSRQAREEAIRSIPFDKLTDATRQKLLDVVGKPTIYRRMPVQSIESDPDMYLFLVRHPEVIVDIWKIMGITKVSVARTGEFTMTATDGVGTHSNVELIYGTPKLHVMFAEGTYEGPLFRRKVHGRCVVVLNSSYSQGEDKTTRVTNRLDVFVQFDHFGAELLAKTFHPLIGKSADHNFGQTTLFIGRLSQAAESNGPGVQRLAARLPNVAPQVRRQFADLALVVSHRAALRNNPLEPDRPPTRQASAD